MKTFASRFDDDTEKKKKFARKDDLFDDSYAKDVVSRFSGDQKFGMSEENHVRHSTRHFDTSGRSIFRNSFFDIDDVQSDERTLNSTLIEKIDGVDPPRFSVTIVLNDSTKSWYDHMVAAESEATEDRLKFRRIYFSSIIIYQQAHGVDMDTAQWIVNDIYVRYNPLKQEEVQFWTNYWQGFSGFTDADFTAGSHDLNLLVSRYNYYQKIVRGNQEIETDILTEDIVGINDVDAYIQTLQTTDPIRYKELLAQADLEYTNRTGNKERPDASQPELKKQWDDIFKDIVKKDLVMGKIDQYPDHVKAYLTPEKLASPQFWQYVRMAELMKNVSAEQYAQFQNEATDYVWGGEPLGGVVTSFESFIKTFQDRLASIDTATTDEELQNIGRSLTLADIMQLNFAQRIKLVKALINRAEFKDQDTIIKITTYFQLSEYGLYIDELIANDYALFQQMDDEMEPPFYATFHAQLKFYAIYVGGIEAFGEGVAKVMSDFNSDEPEKCFGNGTRIIPFSAPGLFGTDLAYSYDITYANGNISIIVKAAGMIPIKVATFKPFDMVGVYVITGKTDVGETGQLLIMPALNLEFLHEKNKSQAWENLMDAVFIVVGIVGMILAPELVTFVIAAIDTAYFVADSIIRSYRNEIAKSEAGREFLETWDVVSGVMMVFGIAQAALALPELFLLLRKGWDGIKNLSLIVKKGDETVDVINAMKKDVETVLDGADEIAGGEKVEAGVTDPEAAKNIKTAELGGPVVALNPLLDDVYDVQKALFARNRNIIAQADSNSKGAWAEIGANSRMTEKGYESLTLRKTALSEGWGETGIDQVFKKNGEYFIQEVKYKGTATLGMTSDGKQMSKPWIEGSNRLTKAVGTEAQNIIDAGYTRILAEVAPDGNIVFKLLDENANIIGDFVP